LTSSLILSKKQLIVFPDFPLIAYWIIRVIYGVLFSSSYKYNCTVQGEIGQVQVLEKFQLFYQLMSGKVGNF
jgi:hypothetical protein